MQIYRSHTGQFPMIFYSFRCSLKPKNTSTSTNKMPCIIIGVESGMQTNKNIKITTLNKMSRVLKYPSKWKHTT